MNGTNFCFESRCDRRENSFLCAGDVSPSLPKKVTDSRRFPVRTQRSILTSLLPSGVLTVPPGDLIAFGGGAGESPPLPMNHFRFDELASPAVSMPSARDRSTTSMMIFITTPAITRPLKTDVQQRGLSCSAGKRRLDRQRPVRSRVPDCTTRRLTGCLWSPRRHHFSANVFRL